MVLVSDLNAVIGTAIAGTVLLSIGVYTLARRRAISKKDAERLRLKFGDIGERFGEKSDLRRLAFVGTGTIVLGVLFYAQLVVLLMKT